MEIKKFNENSNNSITQNTFYEFCNINNNGKEYTVDIDDYSQNYDHHSLEHMILLYLKLKGYEKGWYIKKVEVTEEIIDLKTIPEIDIMINQIKYNL